MVETSLDIQIIRDGVVEKTIQLTSGEYALGREKECQIVLDHEGVSKNHAVLSVTSDRAIINDNESLNGIYYKGKRIKNKTFHRDFEIEVGPFILRGAFRKERQTKLPSFFSIDALASSNIRPLVFLCLMVVMVVTFAIVYFPLNGQVKDLRTQEAMKRGVILARYLSEMNRYSMGLAEYDLVRTGPIGREEGVRYCFIVDVEGTIVAPVENSGDFLEWPGFRSAMKEGKLAVAEGKGEEKIILYPIKRSDKVIGAAIIGYDVERAGKAGGRDITGSSYLLLIVSLVVCGVLGKVLISVFVKPLHRLEEEVSVCVKEGRDHLAFNAPYGEIDNLVRAFNRLLSRAAVVGRESVVEAGVKKSSDAVECAVDAHVSNLKDIASPWCIVDKEGYVIVDHNEAFGDRFKMSGMKQGAHLAEAFDNPAIINAICQLIDNVEEDAVTVDGENPLQVKKAAVEGDEDKALLIFEESSNGQ